MQPALQPTKNRQTAPHGCSFQSRNIRLEGKRTSIRLEYAMWEAFEEIAAREGKTIGALCGIIASRKISANLTAAVRLFIIVYFRAALSQHQTAAQPTHAAANTGAPAQAATPQYSAPMNTALATLE